MKVSNKKLPIYNLKVKFIQINIKIYKLFEKNDKFKIQY